MSQLHCATFGSDLYMADNLSQGRTLSVSVTILPLIFQLSLLFLRDTKVSTIVVLHPQQQLHRSASTTTTSQIIIINIIINNYYHENQDPLPGQKLGGTRMFGRFTPRIAQPQPQLSSHAAFPRVRPCRDIGQDGPHVCQASHW